MQLLRSSFFIVISSVFFINAGYALVGLSNAKANSVIVQTDGKIVVAGSAVVNNVQQGIIARYNANGTLDNSFNGGSVTTPIGDNAVFNAVLQQADGKLVVVGNAELSTSPQYFVLRYNSDGTYDTSFAYQSLSTSVQGQISTATAIAQQTDGKLVIAGISNNTNFVPRFFVARLNSNGTLDTTFGTGGVVFTQNGNTALATAIKIQSDGKIVVSGTSQSGHLAMRYNTNGTLDTTFGNSGISNTVVGGTSQCNSSVIQTDGKIILSGFVDNNFSLVRLTTTGILDPSWGVTGRVSTPFATTAEIQATVLQSDGKVVAAGYMDNQIALARYTTTGALDTSYGTSGQVVTPVGQAARAFGAALQTDGKVVVAGSSNPNLVVTRYTTTGAIDNTIGIISTPEVCSTSLCAFGQVYNVSAQDIPNNALFTFDTAGILNNISFSPPSSNIVFDHGGTYAATYIVEVESQALLQFQLNGNVIQSSNYNSPNTCIAVGKAIFTANAQDVLTLVNITGFDVGVVTGGVNASIIIEKIA